jgi:hypothetical protein
MAAALEAEENNVALETAPRKSDVPRNTSRDGLVTGSIIKTARKRNYRGSVSS